MGSKEKLIRASELYRQREFDLLNILLEKLLTKNSNLFGALHLKALMLHQLEDFDESIKVYNQLIRKNPSRVSLYNNLGNVFLEKKDFQAAEHNYLRALKIETNYGDALINLAIAQKKLSKHVDAEINFKKAVKSHPAEVKYFLNFSVFLTEQGRFSESLDLQLKVLEINNKQSEVYFQIFTNFMFLHQYENALEIADIGLNSFQLNDFQLCELLIGKAILFWLFDNDREGEQAIALSEKIHTIKSKNLNLKNHRVFHAFLKQLFIHRKKNRFDYDVSNNPYIYFISESHGFTPNGMTVKYQNIKHTVKSILITGTKILHLTQEPHQCRSSLKILLNGLPKVSKVVLGFGEIDCRVSEGIYNYCLKYKKDFITIIDSMLEKYIDMLIAENKYAHTFIIYGVPSPHPKAIEKLEEEQKRNFKSLVAYFNLKLEKLCKEQSILFLDVYKLTNDSGVSNLKYHFDNHHVSPRTLPELFISHNN